MAKFRTFIRSSAPPAERDAQTIGTVFIDVLFGAVVAKALDLSSAAHVTALQQAHLVLAVTVTVSAWLGYHNSKNRAKYVIKFFNLPLLQFTIEIMFVYAYWLLVSTASQFGDSLRVNEQKSLTSAADILAMIFILSLAWDSTALAMRKSSKYDDMRVSDDKPMRRLVTRIFLAAFITLAAIVNATKPHGVLAFTLMVLMALAVMAHRWTQNIAQSP